MPTVRLAPARRPLAAASSAARRRAGPLRGSPRRETRSAATTGPSCTEPAPARGQEHAPMYAGGDLRRTRVARARAKGRQVWSGWMHGWRAGCKVGQHADGQDEKDAESRQ
eukprot:4984997-Pleurochrysis_carterae.AAC.1